jgi:hypothetical protein
MMNLCKKKESSISSVCLITAEEKNIKIYLCIALKCDRLTTIK